VGPRVTMPPALWAMLVAPIWVALSSAIMGLLVWMDVVWLPLILLVGWGGGTLVVLMMERNRRVPDMPSLGFGRPALELIIYALIAGLGSAILSSEIDNVMRSHFATPTAAPTEPGPIVAEPLWLHALVSGLFMPLTRAVVVHGIVLRNMVFSAPLSWAVGFSTFAYFFSMSGALHDWLRFALPAGVAGWAYVRSHNVWVSMAALLGSFSGVWLEVFDLSLGVPGFDQTDPAQVLFQPHWFNAAGVALLAAGVGLLIRAFEKRPFSQLVLAADARRPEPPSDD